MQSPWFELQTQNLQDLGEADHFGLQHLQTAALKTGFDLGLFELLSENEQPLDKKLISEKLGADSALIGT